MSRLRRPNMESPLYQRWFPGAGQRGHMGMYGLGEEYFDPEMEGIDWEWDYATGTTGSGETDTEGSSLPGGAIDTSSGETATLDTWQAQADCAEFGGAACAPFVMTGGTPTDAQVKATATLRALNASQLAAAIASGAIVKSAAVGAACPSGLAYKNGVCVPVGGTGVQTTPSGQWVPFATNTQLLTWGGVVIAALVIINLIPSGGGRRR